LTFINDESIPIADEQANNVNIVIEYEQKDNWINSWIHDERLREQIQVIKRQLSTTRNKISIYTDGSLIQTRTIPSTAGYELTDFSTNMGIGVVFIIEDQQLTLKAATS
jgi:hypothetical protein